MGRRLVKGRGWELIRPGAPPPDPAPAARGPLRVALEKRKKGKVVTRVTGLPLDREAVRDLAAELKAACGTGGKAGDGELELQGDHREKVEALLAGRGLR